MVDEIHEGKVLPIDTDLGGDADQPGNSQPISQDEVDDILLDVDTPREERLMRLQELRDRVYSRSTADTTNDMEALMLSLDQAIADLKGQQAGEFMPAESVDRDADERSDAVAPDELEDLPDGERHRL